MGHMFLKEERLLSCYECTLNGRASNGDKGSETANCMIKQAFDVEKYIRYEEGLCEGFEAENVYVKIKAEKSLWIFSSQNSRTV
jgi:hypothetical protein